MHLPDLLGEQLLSAKLTAALSELGGGAAPSMEAKAYSDIVYLNVASVGISLAFTPTKGYKPKTGAVLDTLDHDRLHCTGIDVHNGRKPYAPYPSFPIELSIPSPDDPRLSTVFAVTPDTTGKDFVQACGEPDRKGQLKRAIWMEWSTGRTRLASSTSVGCMVELDVAGANVWRDGAMTKWAVLTLFEPGAPSGMQTDEA
jgi:hypothetical protein